MDKKSFVIKAEVLVAAITIIVIALCGIFCGKVVEGSLFEEVAKWVVMGIVTTAIVCLVLYWPLNVLADWVERKRK